MGFSVVGPRDDTYQCTRVVNKESFGLEVTKGFWKKMALRNFKHEDKMQYGLQQLFIGSFLVLNDDPN